MGQLNQAKLKVVLLLAVLAAAGAALILRAVAQGREVVTPVAVYSVPGWREKATKYQANLARVQADHVARFKPDQFKFYVTGESTVGGVGFWGNPVTMGAPQRYLAVFARVQVPPPSTGRAFPDTQSGRILTIMDAYGKDTINIMAREIQLMPEPEIAGGAIIFIYSKLPVTDPGFEQNAEALALFMPKGNLILFSQLRMTIQNLFSSSQMLPIFQGGDQIQNLRLYIIQP